MSHQTSNIYDDLAFNVLNASRELDAEEAFTYARQAIQIAHNNGFTLGVLKCRKDSRNNNLD